MRLFLSFLCALIMVAPATAQESASELVRIDRNHSTLGFNVPIVAGLSKVTGKFTDFSVDLIWNEDNLDSSSVSVTILVESIDTGIDGRNNHLRSADFFDVESFPEITFVSEKIVESGADYLAKGVFTMHGVSHEIFLPFSVDSFHDATEDHTWNAFTIDYTLDRTDYGMNWTHSSVDYFVGNEIEADIVIITR